MTNEDRKNLKEYARRLYRTVPPIKESAADRINECEKSGFIFGIPFSEVAKLFPENAEPYTKLCIAYEYLRIMEYSLEDETP